MQVHINTGADAHFENAEVITDSDLGVRYSSFRSIDRLLEQTDHMNVGVISWPGGTLAERYVDDYGFEYPGLTNPASGRPDLTKMMEVARAEDVGLSIVLPTHRYQGHIADMRADVQNFMQDLLSGEYGDLPKELTFHVGSEYYTHFKGVKAAANYGKIANAMVDQLRQALHDPSINPDGVDIKISVQAGKTMADDQNIRDAFSDENMREVDLVMHHRYAARADKIDNEMDKFMPQLEAWRSEVIAAGGDRPDVHLSEWNVASLTRNEGLTKYVDHMAAKGVTINPADIDMAGRTDTDFENYWQNILTTRDYGIAQPRLYLELFSQYQSVGLGAATIHALDFAHSGRITFVDSDKDPVTFVGGEMIGMLYESVEGTQVCEISTENDRSDDVSTYAYDSDDRVVVFLAADADKVGGEITVDIEGMGKGYTAVFTVGLSAYVPENWMEMFSIPDNPEVDESNEGNTFALGDRHAVDTVVDGNQVTVTMTHPGEVVRIIVANSAEEAARVAEFAGDPVYVNDPDAPEEATDAPLLHAWIDPTSAFVAPALDQDRVEATAEETKTLNEQLSLRPEASSAVTKSTVNFGPLIAGRTLDLETDMPATSDESPLFPEGKSAAPSATTPTSLIQTSGITIAPVDEDVETTDPTPTKTIQTGHGRIADLDRIMTHLQDVATGLPMFQIAACFDDEEEDDTSIAHLMVV